MLPILGAGKHPLHAKRKKKTHSRASLTETKLGAKTRATKNSVKGQSTTYAPLMPYGPHRQRQPPQPNHKGGTSTSIAKHTVSTPTANSHTQRKHCDTEAGTLSSHMKGSSTPYEARLSSTPHAHRARAPPHRPRAGARRHCAVGPNGGLPRRARVWG